MTARASEYLIDQFCQEFVYRVANRAINSDAGLCAESECSDCTAPELSRELKAHIDAARIRARQEEREACVAVLEAHIDAICRSPKDKAEQRALLAGLGMLVAATQAVRDRQHESAAIRSLTPRAEGGNDEV